ETATYHKREVLYGLDKAKVALRQLGFGIIVEGNMDVVGLHQAGFLNAVCSGGTALTAEQFTLMSRYAPKWMFAFDPDAAGVEATKRAFRDALKTDLEVYALVLPQGKDPDEVVIDSPDVFREAIKNALPMMQYFFHMAREQFPAKNLEAKKGITKMLLPVIKDLSSAVERSHFLQELSRLVSVEVPALQEAMGKIKSLRPALPPERAKKDHASSGSTPFSSREEKVSKEILALLLGKPELIRSVLERLPPEHFSQERFIRLYKEAVSYYNTQVQREEDASKLTKGFEDFEQSLRRHHPDLASLVSELSLLYEKEFSQKDDKYIENRIVEYVQALSRAFMHQQLKTVRRELAVAEQAGNRERVDELGQSVQFLMESLRGLER
ncbi:MAG TPA: toprim domain-containing protein, partial [Patescibacteria group bacterium]|nr:toprim domain-containing protein [Patescibacteria group bacterium]